MSNCWEYRDQDIYIPQDMRRELECWHHRMEFKRACRNVGYGFLILAALLVIVGGSVWLAYR